MGIPGGSDGQRSNRNEVAEDLEFLVRPPDRSRIMSKPSHDGQCSRDARRATSDTPRITVQRNLDALKERAWISNRGQTYTISPCGKLITEGVLDLVDTTDIANELEEFLWWTSLDDFEADGPAEVYLNGTKVDPETFGAASLILPSNWQHTTRTRAGVR